MIRYRLAESGVIKELIENAVVMGLTYIPLDETLPDYQDYLEWLALGNTPDPIASPPPNYSLFKEVSGTVLTTNATPTELVRRTLAPGNLYVADYFVMAIQNGSPYNCLYGRWMQGVKRVSTTAALVGVQADIIPAQGDAAAVNLKVSAEAVGTDFRIMVTGLAGVSIRWILRGTFVQGSPVDLS